MTWICRLRASFVGSKKFPCKSEVIEDEIFGETYLCGHQNEYKQRIDVGSSFG